MQSFSYSLAFALLVFLPLRTGRCDDPSFASPVLKTASTVSATYYLSLPKNWSADKKWPVLVTLDGSGHKFQENCQAFMKARGDGPFIIVTPCVSSNGKDPADLAAVIAIFKEVQKETNAESKFFVTGFSAGGHVMWQLVFNHPELLAGAVPSAANFRFRGINVVSQAEERTMLPIHGINGDKDLVVINEQWDDAEEHARKNGYKNLSHLSVKGGGHSPYPAEVIKYFSTLIAR